MDGVHSPPSTLGAKVAKFFSKKKHSSNKENIGSLKRETLERASTRSEVGQSNVYTGGAMMDQRVMRAIPNPYAVWTQPKKNKGPSSCPGAPLNESASHYMRPSHRASTRRTELSMIVEQHRGEELYSRPHHHHRSSHRRPSSHHKTYDAYTSESEDDEDEDPRNARIFDLERMVEKLKSDKSRHKHEMTELQDHLNYCMYECKSWKKQVSQIKKELEQTYRHRAKLQNDLSKEREMNENLQQRLSEMSCSSSSAYTVQGENGARERLVSSSESSVEMSEDEKTNNARRRKDDELTDEVRVFRGEDGEEEGRQGGEQDVLEKEIPRSTRKNDQDTGSLEFDLRRSASDTRLHYSDDLDQTMPVEEKLEHSHGTRNYRKDDKTMYIRPSASIDSSDSDDETQKLREKQLRKIGEVVKFNPPRQSIKEKRVYRRYAKPEQSALNKFEFLEEENTDLSGILSSPDVTCYPDATGYY